MKKELLNTILASLLIMLFLYTGVSKLGNIPLFIDNMEKQVVPEWSKKILVFALPIVEIIASILLIIPRTRIKGFYLSLVLMIAFTIYIGLGVLHVFSRVPCTCGGVFGMMSWPNHFILNIFFTAVSALGIRTSYNLGKPINTTKQVEYT